MLLEFREQLFVCQKHFFICGSTADIVVSLTASDHYTKAITFARGRLNETLAVFDQCTSSCTTKCHPARSCALYDALAETLPKALVRQPKLVNDQDRRFWRRCRSLSTASRR
jgi:hypothetical protein